MNLIKHYLKTDAQNWNVRVGQIETVLSYFGSLCSISVALTAMDGTPYTVYLQGRRHGEEIEVELISNTYLPTSAQLSDEKIAHLLAVGWTAPEPPAWPNFRWSVRRDGDLRTFGLALAVSLSILNVDPEQAWVVSPPEFDNQEAGLAGSEAVEATEVAEADDPDDAAAEDDRLQGVLASGSGLELLAAITSDRFTFADLVAAGLPRDDKLAAMAMLYRPDCPLEFLRASRFKLEVLEDPNLPTATARALLAEKPNPSELGRLARRTDLRWGELLVATEKGERLARWAGQDAGRFLALRSTPVARLELVARQHTGEVIGMLRNRRCPEGIVLDYLLHRSARVRLAALGAVKARDLAVDSALIRAARDIPMTEQRNTDYPCAERVQALANEILEAR